MERKLGAAVVETRRRAARFPAASCMAALASACLPIHFRGREGAFVRIDVAILASGKRQALIVGGGFSRIRAVAFFAGYILMQTG